jgi:hypothetical protein
MFDRRELKAGRPRLQEELHEVNRERDRATSEETNRERWKDDEKTSRWLSSGAGSVYGTVLVTPERP